MINSSHGTRRALLVCLARRLAQCAHLCDVECDECIRSRGGGVLQRRAGVRELRRHPHASLAERRNGPLPLQRVRPLPQDERHEQAAGEAAAPAGTCEAPGGTRASARRCTRNNQTLFSIETSRMLAPVPLTNSTINRPT